MDGWMFYELIWASPSFPRPHQMTSLSLSLSLSIQRQIEKMSVTLLSSHRTLQPPLELSDVVTGCCCQGGEGFGEEESACFPSGGVTFDHRRVK